MSGGPAIVTAAAFPFRSRARVMLRSLRRFHPAVELFALSVAETEPSAEAFAGASRVRLDELGIPDLPGFRFRYTCREVAIAAKPFLLAHALDRGFSPVLFLDADLWILADLEDLFRQVGAHSLTLTSHRLQPGATAAEELRLLRSGTFNGGVVGASAGGSRRFLDWWGSRVHADCRMAPEAGLHDDQRWLDLAPGFVDDLAIVNDPGVNVAYWNLDERPLALRGERWFAGGVPLRLFHFSGFDVRNLARASRHSPMPVDPFAALFFAVYARNVAAEDMAVPPEPGEDCETEYLARAFANGVPIPRLARALYPEWVAAGGVGDPTACGRGSFFDWLLEPEVEGAAGPAGGTVAGSRRLPRLWLEIFRSRPDLQRAFPEPGGRDHARFLDWARHHGRVEYDLAAAFLPAEA